VAIVEIANHQSAETLNTTRANNANGLTVRFPSVTMSVMTLGPWQSRTIPLRWPDSRGGELELTVELVLLEGRWEPVGLHVGFAAGVAPRALQTADLRGLGMTGILEAAHERLLKQLAEAAASELATVLSAPSSQTEYRKRLLEQRRREEALLAAGSKRAGRPRLRLKHLEEVAEVYAQAYAEHRPPRQAVAAYFKISPTAAASRIARARKAGLLGLSGRGRAASGPLIHGSSADVLERLIAIKEFMAQRDAKSAAEEQFGEGSATGRGQGEGS